MKLGKKIAIGYAGILSLTLIVGISGYIAMGYIMKGIAIYQNVQKIQKEFSTGNEYVNHYILNNYDEARSEQAKAEAKALRHLKISLKAFKKIGEYRITSNGMVKQTESELTEYLSEFEKYADSENRKIELEKYLAQEYAAVSGLISKAGFLTENMHYYNELVYAATLSYFSRNTEKRWQYIETGLKEMKKAIEEWHSKIERSPVLNPICSDIRKRFQAYHVNIFQYRNEVNNQNKCYENMLRNMKNIHNLFLELGAATSNQMNRFRRLALIFLLGITVCALAAGSLYSYVSARSTVIPVRLTSEYLRRLSEGDLPGTMTHKSADEFKEISNSMNLLIQATDDIILIAEKISDGDLVVKVEERSENDRMMKALNRMAQRLNGIMEEINGMIQAVGKGKLDIRGNSEAFKGGWQELVSGVNDLIENLSNAVSKSATLTLEMELARNIQTCLLPTSIRDIHPDFEISAAMLTADEVGGDFYDVITDTSGSLWLGIGDVSGHGVTPGLIMMMAQTVHATLISHLAWTPQEVITAVNNMLYRNVHERLGKSHHMTFTAMKYIGRGKFIHAGLHDDLIVWRNEKKDCEFIETKGVFLNFVDDIAEMTEDSYFTLDAGDILILYTDGLTEAENRDGEILDIGRFVDIIKKYAHLKLEAMKENIMADVLRWSDNRRDDDMSIVIVKRKEAQTHENA